MVLKEDLESLANPISHPEDLSKAIFYHPKDLQDGVDYQKIFMHLGACKICRTMINNERERNPLYQGYIQAVRENRVKEYWDAVRKLQGEYWDVIREAQEEIFREFKHKD